VIGRYDRLARRIEDGIESLQRAVDRARKSWYAARRDPSAQDVYVDSVALNLHGFYTGVERLFELTVRDVDGATPGGSEWHTALLEQVSISAEGIRPAVISPQTASLLDEFRRFRHLVRNIYADRLEPARIGPLIDALDDLWSRLEPELREFGAWLRALSEADDSLPP
jgi:hypothetical protein